MKKILLILALAMAALPALAQKQGGRGGALTLPVLDSQVVARYNQYSPKLAAVIDAYNGTLDSVKRASLTSKYEKLQAQCDAELLSIYAKNLRVEGVTERIYSMRTSMAKDKLEKIYDKLSADAKLNDAYAKSIRAHLDTRQIELGDTLGDFRAVSDSGLPFRYSEFKNEKDLLLIFGSLSSLAVDARLLLQVSYRDIDLSQLEIVSIFTNETTQQEFEANSRYSGIEWLKISDYLGDHSPLKIAFGVQATPMCFYVSRGGAVEYISLGIDDEIMRRIKEKSYKK